METLICAEFVEIYLRFKHRTVDFEWKAFSCVFDFNGCILSFCKKDTVFVLFKSFNQLAYSFPIWFLLRFAYCEFLTYLYASRIFNSFSGHEFTCFNAVFCCYLRKGVTRFDEHFNYGNWVMWN